MRWQSGVSGGGKWRIKSITSEKELPRLEREPRWIIISVFLELEFISLCSHIILIGQIKFIVCFCVIMINRNS